jgi:beta-glucosidase
LLATTEPPRFPPGFVWGAATSAYQIEGSPLADGAGPSIWHRFAHTPGATANGETGDTACDHYRRYAADVALMARLGLGAYRFSIAWARVLPAGRGTVNPAGLGFYDRLVDALLAHGIQPLVTLYHWDLPLALDERGGWLVRDSAQWFAEYARVVVRALGDRVGLWTTINEPWVVSDGGYLHGTLAPGHRDPAEAGRVSHHLLCAHGAAVQAIRAEGARQVGLVVNLEPKFPASQAPDDLAATRRADAYMNRQFLDAALLGRYPEELSAVYGADRPEVRPEDFVLIRQPLDFLGINYYTRAVVRHDPEAPPLHAARVRQDQHRHTTTDWEVYAPALGDALRGVRQRYGPLPLYVTENGAAFDDPPVADGDVADAERVAYLRDHLRAARETIAAGVDLRGYFVWSLLDNFEWSAGYAKRFGLVHVDYATQRRTPKASARFYGEVIRSHGTILGP